MGQHTKLHLKTDDFYFKIKVQQGGFMKSRKTRLFILAVILMMAFAGCREYATPISNSKNIETTVRDYHWHPVRHCLISMDCPPPGEEMVLTLHPQK